MGCDIHIAIEVYDRYAEGRAPWCADSLWEDYGSYMSPQYAEGTTLYEAGMRNYRLFTVLAGVRDYGKYDGDKEWPTAIGEPRGVPTDVGKCVQQWVDGFGVDGHSHSYYTLGELKLHRKQIAAVSEAWDKLIDYMQDRLDKVNQWASKPEQRLTDSQIRVVFFFDN